MKLPGVKVTIQAGPHTLSFTLKDVTMTIGKKLGLTSIEIIGARRQLSRLSFLLDKDIQLDITQPPKRVKCEVIQGKTSEPGEDNR